MFDLRITRTKLLVFVAFSLQFPQPLCLQTTSLRTCSLDVTTTHLAEEVLQVLYAYSHLAQLYLCHPDLLKDCNFVPVLCCIFTQHQVSFCDMLSHTQTL